MRTEHCAAHSDKNTNRFTYMSNVTRKKIFIIQNMHTLFMYIHNKKKHPKRSNYIKNIYYLIRFEFAPYKTTNKN